MVSQVAIPDYGRRKSVVPSDMTRMILDAALDDSVSTDRLRAMNNEFDVSHRPVAMQSFPGTSPN